MSLGWPEAKNTISGTQKSAERIETHVSLPSSPIENSFAWRAADISPSDWRVKIGLDALAELDTIADALSDYTGPLDDLEPDAFDWPATADLMAEVRMRLTNGIGFALLDRLPVERWNERACRGIAWMLNCFVAVPIKQKKNGARLYDVFDTGAKKVHGVRRSITNLDQEFHTDGSWLALTPKYLSLVCLRQAAIGGGSRVASLVTAHNDIMCREPALWRRLYEPYWWDRQAEHGSGDILATWRPVFEWDGEQLMVRYYDDYVREGHRLMEAPLDAESDGALRAMKACIEAPENAIEFRLRPGQIEFANNQTIAHGRSCFEDIGNADRKRMLLRFWLRTVGGIELDAELAPAG